MRVHAVETRETSAYSAELDAMHRHRHRLFVELMGWEALRQPDGREIDGFDTAAATYLLALDHDGVLRGSIRLLPTTGPHMLRDVFAEFTASPAPCGPTTMEWTRHAPGDPVWPAAVNTQARHVLHLGALEYAARTGITAFTGLMETWLVRRARALGWPCETLGPARAYGEGEAVAVLNRVREGHLEWLRQRTGIAAPVLAPSRLVDAAA